VLITNKEPCKSVEVHASLIIDRSKGFKELGGDGKEWYVLKIRVMVQAVDRNVVHVVVALPPPDAYASHTVPCQYLCVVQNSNVKFVITLQLRGTLHGKESN
jgi:hypothetical protein